MNENRGRLVDRLIGVAGRRGAGRHAGAARAAMSTVAMLLLLGATAAAQAQNPVTLISNELAPIESTSLSARARAFTTGVSNPGRTTG